MGADPNQTTARKPGLLQIIQYSLLGRIEMDGTAGWQLFALVLLQKVKMVEGGGQVRQTGTGGELSGKVKGIISPDG